jgi:hypothetical protein
VSGGHSRLDLNCSVYNKRNQRHRRMVLSMALWSVAYLRVDIGLVANKRTRCWGVVTTNSLLSSLFRRNRNAE